MEYIRELAKRVKNFLGDKVEVMFFGISVSLLAKLTRAVWNDHTLRRSDFFFALLFVSFRRLLGMMQLRKAFSDCLPAFSEFLEEVNVKGRVLGRSIAGFPLDFMIEYMGKK